MSHKAPKPENHLYYGDNLSRIRQMPPHSVDLIYLDPFNSRQNYSLVYKAMTGLPVPHHAEAFCDSWDMDLGMEKLAHAMPALMRELGMEVCYIQFWTHWVSELRQTQPQLLAYLIYMVPRLLHMKRILRPTGSIYLHCDPSVSHYIKVMMDGIFGHKNFRNEIIWQRTNAHNFRSYSWARVHDVILYYTASEKYTFNKLYGDFSPQQLGRYEKEPGTERLYTGQDMTIVGGDLTPWRGTVPNGNRGWGMPLEERERLWDAGLILKRRDGSPRLDGRKVYLDEKKGVPISDVWIDIKRLANTSAERLGYPAQKPLSLLDRIIQTSSNEGDVVFDPFCGCGTTLYSAERNGRRWVGCDIAILPIRIVREILTGNGYRLRENVDFSVRGNPTSLEQAEELLEDDPAQFEHWIVEHIGGFPTKKAGESGIAGSLYFKTENGLGRMALSIKGQDFGPAAVGDIALSHAPNIEMAGFLSLQEPSKAMREAAAKAGQYVCQGVRYDRVQFLTLKQVMEESARFRTPATPTLPASLSQDLAAE